MDSPVSMPRELTHLVYRIRLLKTSPPSFHRYIHSDTFDDLSKAVEHSMIGSSLDEIVVLIDLEMMTGPQAPREGVRRIMYCTEEDLVTALGLAGAPVGLDKLEMHDVPGNISHAHERDEVSGKDDAATGPSSNADPEGENHEPTTQLPDDFYITHSEEEILNARAIQRACRRRQGRNKLRGLSGIEGRAYKSFETCLRSLDEEKMHQLKSNHQYRWRYLGVVPYLLASVDIIYDQLHAAKRKAKKGLKPLEHNTLEGISERFGLLK